MSEYNNLLNGEGMDRYNCLKKCLNTNVLEKAIAVNNVIM